MKQPAIRTPIPDRHGEAVISSCLSSPVYTCSLCRRHLRLSSTTQRDPRRQLLPATLLSAARHSGPTLPNQNFFVDVDEYALSYFRPINILLNFPTRVYQKQLQDQHLRSYALDPLKSSATRILPTTILSQRSPLRTGSSQKAIFRLCNDILRHFLLL